MPLFVILLIGGIVAYVYFRFKKLNNTAKDMLESGEIIKREGNFYDKAYIFTLRPVTSTEINDVLKEVNFMVSVSGKTNDIHFSGRDFQARLWTTTNTDSYCIYKFEVTKWSNTDGSPEPESLIMMNQLLTSVEKMLLKLDPNTQVRSEEVSRKTSIDFL